MNPDFDAQITGTSGARFGDALISPSGDAVLPGITSPAASLGPLEPHWRAGVPVTTNQISNNSFETNFSGWSTSGTGTWIRRQYVLEPSVVYSPDGLWGILVTAPAGSTGTMSTSIAFPSPVGVNYTTTAWAFRIGTAVTVRIRMLCLRADFSVAADYSHDTALPSQTWTCLSVSGLVPADTALIVPEITHLSPGSATTYMIDAVWCSPLPDSYALGVALSHGFRFEPDYANPVARAGTKRINDIEVVPNRPYRLRLAGQDQHYPFTVTVYEHDEYTAPEVLATVTADKRALAPTNDTPVQYNTAMATTFVPTQPRLDLVISKNMPFFHFTIEPASDFLSPALWRPILFGSIATQDILPSSLTVTPSVEEPLVTVILAPPPAWTGPITYAVMVVADGRAENTTADSRRVRFRLSTLGDKDTLRQRTMRIGAVAGRSVDHNVTLAYTGIVTVPPGSATVAYVLYAAALDDNITVTSASLTLLAIPVF